MPSSSSFRPHQHHSTIADISRQIRINLILKSNLILFISILTSNVQRLVVSFVVSATTAPAEIRTMANARSVGVVGFEIF